MVRSKAPAKKQQKHGVDFKKIKRKLGRKLPPPKNATNTEIKSKAIILPEQSVAAEKAGLALSKKGLTLKELLQQTSHHNAKVRKDALLGLRDLFQSHPTELHLHKCAVIEKLRLCIADDDKLVRETFYQLFKSVIFPSCKEDNQGPIVSLLMAYICNAMTNLSIDVRLMAFKFFDLVLWYYPPTFSLYAEKILQNYKEIIQNNKLFVQDKGKLKVVLSGLAHCLSLLTWNQVDTDSHEKDPSQNEVLHSYEGESTKGSVRFAHISGKLKEIIAVLINCFQDFILLVHAMPVLDAQSFDCMHHILCGINHTVKFLIDRTSPGLLVSVPPSEGPDLMIWDQAMSSMFLKKLLGVFPLNLVNHLSEKGDERYFILNSVMTGIFLRVTELIYPPVDLRDKFLEFIENKLLGKVTSSTRPSRSIHEKNLLPLLPFFPKLLLRVEHGHREGLLQAFTLTFNDCKPESQLKMACISTVEEMVVPNEDILYVTASGPEICSYQIAWINELPSLLNQLGDQHPSCTQAVLRLLLRLGQNGFLSASHTFEDDIRNFYSTYQGKDPHLEPSLLYRMVEVMHCAYRAGYIQITDHISFFITLVTRFPVFPERVCLAMESDAQETNCDTFKALTRIVSSCLLEMGDTSLVFQILEKVLLEQINSMPPLDNGCAMLRIICALDSNPTRLSEHSIITLSEFLPAYLIDVVNSTPEEDAETSSSINTHTWRYYLVPCFFLFERSRKLVNQVLSKLESRASKCTSELVSGQKETDGSSLNMILTIVSIILLIHSDVKARKIISSSKSEIDHILHNVLSLQSLESTNLTIEGKHKTKIAGERLRIASSSLLT